MAALWQNLRLELALHLADHQRLIETIGACQQQQARHWRREEQIREALEPSYTRHESLEH